ncbi:ATP-binding protein [Streptomyces sp. NPDC005859]|uniref:ATP-binding protein n=1 Tax=Streptomyces sp. NPDC005859 TaxID=3157170 RepID=UPI00340E507A
MEQLVGRSAELDRFDAVLADLGRAGAVSAVDISGEPGIGKSRLLIEVCARARRAGFTLLRGRATEYEQHVPFQVFTDALADAVFETAPSAPFPTETGAGLYGVLGRHDGGAATALFGFRAEAGGLSYGPGEGSDGGAAARFGPWHALAALLARLGDPGVALALDDLHWADPASRELVNHLVRHPPRGRVLLVLARRSRQTPTSLNAALTRGIDAGAVLHLPLGPLPERESIQALAGDLPAGPGRAVVRGRRGQPPLQRQQLVKHSRTGRKRGSAFDAGSSRAS